MTMIAGIVNRDRERRVPGELCDALRRSLSRAPADQVVTSEGPGRFLVKLDIGVFGEAAEIAGEGGNITLVCGEPLLTGGTGRAHETAQIHKALELNNLSVLRSANGVFSAAHYSKASGDLLLVTDKLGIRPLYYWLGEQYLIFASTLRTLEGLAEVPKIMDVRAVTEMVGLGYALADHTPYAGIKLLRPAEILCLTDGRVSTETYYQWDEIGTSDAPESELLSEVYERFDAAITRRIGYDTATSAYLSGGLDSRCIVAALRASGIEVQTYNFARPGTQDLIFGREFAREIGSIHSEVPKGSGDMVPDYSQLMADAISAVEKLGKVPERPGVVWSGEGGSVALGHVHLTKEMVAWMRAGEIDRVIAEYIRRESAAVSHRLFHRDVAAAQSGITEKGIKAELARFNSPDPARNFYLFLLLNDQHRKLTRHFENIDLHRLEFQLPFFDSDLLRSIIALPLDSCLRHRFYVKWLSFLAGP